MPPKARHTASTISGVVVSSSAMPRVPSPIRRLMASARARETISLCLSPPSTVTVSKNASAARRKAELAQTGRQHRRAAMHGAGDVREPLRPVIDRIHRGDHRQQHLRGADVGGRLLAADMLLAGLQRQPIGRLRRANRSTARRCGRAASVSAHRAPPCRRHAARHIPSARRNRCAEPIAISAPSSPGEASERQRQEIGRDHREPALAAQRW